MADANLQEREMTRNIIQPKTVHLAICVYEHVEDIYEKTMSEIERATDRMLDNILEAIHVSDGEVIPSLLPGSS